jgi:hypothetical protein
MPTFLLSISALLFSALTPLSLLTHLGDGPGHRPHHSQSAGLSSRNLLAENSLGHPVHFNRVGDAAHGWTVDEALNGKDKRGFSHQDAAGFKNLTGGWKAAEGSLILNKLNNDSLGSVADAQSEFLARRESTSTDFKTLNATSDGTHWPFPPKIENPEFNSGSPNSFFSTEIARRRLQAAPNSGFSSLGDTNSFTVISSDGTISTQFVSSTGRKPRINPNSTNDNDDNGNNGQGNSNSTHNTTNSTGSGNSTNATVNETGNNNTTNQTTNNGIENTQTNGTISNSNQSNQTDSLNDTSNSTSSNQTASTNTTANTTLPPANQASTNTSANGDGSSGNSTSSGNSSNTTITNPTTNSTTNAPNNNTSNTTTTNTTTDNSSNATTNTSTNGNSSIIIKPPNNNYQVNNNPTTPTDTSSNSQTPTSPSSTTSTSSPSSSSASTPSSSQTNTGTVISPSTSGNTSKIVDTKDSATGQQTTTSSQVSVTTDGSSPTINIEKRGQLYQFSISGFNKNVAIASNQQKIELSLNPSIDDLTDTVTFSSPLTTFEIPADTHLITIDFGAYSNCLLPLFLASNSKYPAVTVTGTNESPGFKVETDYTQSAGFFYNTIKSTSETYSYTSGVSQARSSDFKSQTVAIINPSKKQPAYGIVYCPYFTSEGSSFSGSIQITTQPKSISEVVWPSNSTQDLSSMVHRFYVPYGGNYTMDLMKVPAELQFSFNSSNTELVFSVEYDTDSSAITQEWKQIDTGKNVEFIVPMGKSVRVFITNLNADQGVILALTVTPPGGSTSPTVYIIIGVIVGVAVIASLVVLVLWMRRRKRLQEIIRLNKQERLLSDPQSSPDVHYPILSGLNPNSPTNLSDEDEEKKCGAGPLLSDELPDSQKVLPHILSTENLPGLPEQRIEIYTLNIDDFSNPEVNDHADNIILETRDRSTK